MYYKLDFKADRNGDGKEGEQSKASIVKGGGEQQSGDHEDRWGEGSGRKRRQRRGGEKCPEGRGKQRGVVSK